MGSQLAFKSRIASTASLEKIFKAQEMIASSHITKARDVALSAKPYSDAIFDAVRVLASHEHLDHPIVNRREDNPRVAVLSITSDRGMAGAYTSSIIKETEFLLSRLEESGREPQLYVYGRRGVTYYKYRGRSVANTWEGHTDAPGVETADEISQALIDAYMKPGTEGGVSELYIVYTEFVNMVSQQVRIIRMLPVQIVDEGDAIIKPYRAHAAAPLKRADIEQAAEANAQAAANGGIFDEKPVEICPLYNFEPSPDEVLDRVLPQYVRARIHECLLTSAASETASRQNAMHTATENAHKLIDVLTRKLNASRQASITQELTEIIGSADALNTEEE